MENKWVELLKDGVINKPHPALILAAKFLINSEERDDIPDWVGVLAGGNVDMWEAVLEETIFEMGVEENVDIK